ncbi:hypothetical protein HMPREF0813_01584 [Streptococcus anginosus F0211]|uniref:Uncharacterized protein n=1 Tax=Streptococcus anginosus F0211 TaxID=706437 RepID=E6J2U4_STRAP|nr:hypothetical protein [Streptococcus constellatus]ANW85989.1 hypothetical protein SanJ4206_1738 [Streptococcus anginosus]EFU21853.1 hypothetical protein HMPREF0813_01584 [Streptococcus anginosus F0211]ETS95256.1 hypothetical protein HMPREF1512_0861 [Streptococcus sp. OBRC6]EUC75621.1 hypothetical protein HMPREF1511_0618 [Streptococcus sp. CM7]
MLKPRYKGRQTQSENRKIGDGSTSLDNFIFFTQSLARVQFHRTPASQLFVCL